MPHLSIVIPSWNAAGVLAPHLPRILDEAAHVAGGVEVLVVDDGSDAGLDATIALVAAAGPPARLIRRPQHEGFMATANAGAREAAGEFLLFLNTDMHVEEGCFETLLAALDRHSEAFAVTPVIVNLEEGFAESTTRIRFRRGVLDPLSPGRNGQPPPQPGELRRIAYPCGGAMACRRRQFLDLGGFLELYGPVYWDDADIGWRARRTGYEVLEVGAARILHDHASTIGAHYAPARIGRLYERNRLLCTWINLVGARAWLAHLGWLFPRWAGAVLRRQPAGSALPLALARLPCAWRERRRQRPTRAVARELLAEVMRGGAAGWPIAPQTAPSGAEQGAKRD
jgi:GT2 family glycosyltransferase